MPYVGLVLAYLLGSVPAAYIAGRVVKGIDLRQHGSGNLGATNVYRVLGAKVAVVVLLFDAFKGAIPVHYFPPWLVPNATPDHALEWAIAYGVAAIAGHVRPIFLLWKGGGKGVATAAGVFTALAPLPMLITLVVFALIVMVSGYVSLGSLIAAALLPIILAIVRGVHSPLLVLAIVIALFVLWTHRANIRRLRRGEEHRFGRNKAT